MLNLLRACAGQYVKEGSLTPKNLSIVGLINNAFEGYAPPKVTGGTESTNTVKGIRYRFHEYTGSSSLTVSGNPRVTAQVSCQGGGGGGSARWNYGEYGGGGGTGGTVTGKRQLSSGSNTVTIGHGGARSDGGCGATGGTSSALGLNANGGSGGCWTGSNGGSAGSTGATSNDTPPPGTASSWGVNVNLAGGGGGGAGGRWFDNTGGGPYNTLTGSGGASGKVVISYRISR